jgi:hypothetical protein
MKKFKHAIKAIAYILMIPVAIWSASGLEPGDVDDMPFIVALLICFIGLPLASLFVVIAVVYVAHFFHT